MASPWRARGVSLAMAVLLSACSSSQPGTGAPVPISPGSATTLQDAYVSVVKQVAPSVVQIQTDQGLGSGIIFDRTGDIVTNAHVIANATAASVTLASGRQKPAALVGAYLPDDLAVIHIDAQGLPRPASFADSGRLEVGTIVMALGNPLGLRSSVTAGIVSAVGRPVSEGSGVLLPDVIQTSAQINPGNSGGALVDLAGKVVGIPTLAAADPQLGGGAAPGIGFAIPSNRVRDIAGQLVAHGRVINSHRGDLGLKVGRGFSGEVIVVVVDPSGSAAGGGVKPGDQITAVNGRVIRSVSDLIEAVAALKPRDPVTLNVMHDDGSAAKLSMSAGELPGG